MRPQLRREIQDVASTWTKELSSDEDLAAAFAFKSQRRRMFQAIAPECATTLFASTFPAINCCYQLRWRTCCWSALVAFYLGAGRASKSRPSHVPALGSYAQD